MTAGEQLETEARDADHHVRHRHVAGAPADVIEPGELGGGTAHEALKGGERIVGDARGVPR